MKQESTTSIHGHTVYRWIVRLGNGKEVVTWAEDERTARQKVLDRRGMKCQSIRPAGNPLEDKPNGR